MTTWRAPENRATTAAMMPIGPGAGDENILAEHGKRKRRVNRISEGIENRGDLARDRARVLPHVHHRQDDVLGERARAVHSHALRVAHRWRRPARQLRQRPQTTCPSPLTRSPG